MARLQSLGLFEPSGLRYLISEGLLPENADSSQYTWHSQLFVDDAGETGVEEVLRVARCVIWSRNSCIKRVFNLDIEGEAILHAFSTSFLSSPREPREIKLANSDGPREAALVVVLKTQAHIFALSGGINVIPLSFEVSRALPFSGGCILQADSLQSVSWTKYKASRSLAGLQILTTPDLQPSFPFDTTEPNSNHGRTRRMPSYCITDQLSDVGLVAASHTRKSPDIKDCPLWPPEEELLYMSTDGQLPPESFKDVCVAVSLNKTTSTITVWQVKTAQAQASESQSTSSINFRKRQSSSFHERSRIASGRAPVETARESFGGLMQSFVEPDTKPQSSQLSNIEHLAAELGQGFEPNGVQTRSARRISSMLARTDLAPATERSAFNETVVASRKSLSRTIRQEGSFGSFTERNSFGGRKSFLATSNYSNTTSFLNLNSRVSLGDSISYGNVTGSGLDVFDDRLEKGVLLVKIKSFLCHEKSVQSDRPEFQVVLIPHPDATSMDGNVQRQISLCIHERGPQTMTVVTIAAKYNHVASPSSQVELKAIQIQKGSNIADACLVSEDGIYRLVVLTKTSAGHDVLHLEAPWSSSYRLDLPKRYLMHELHKFNLGAKALRKADGERTNVFKEAQVKFSSFLTAFNLSTFTTLDDFKTMHKLRIKLRPDHVLTNRVIQLCRYVLPGQLRDSILVAYWEVWRWLSTQDYHSDLNFTALAITLFVLALPFISSLQKPPTTPGRKKKQTSMRSSIGPYTDVASWNAMQAFENKRSSAAWMKSAPWTWPSDDSDVAGTSPGASQKRSAPLKSSSEDRAPLLPLCVDLTRDFLQSPAGESMTGPEGYLPTAMNQERNTRRTALASIVVALFLLLQELTLEPSPADTVDNDRVILSVLIRQLSSWLRWPGWTAYMETQLLSNGVSPEAWGMDQSIVDNLEVPPEPFSPAMILEHIDASLRGQPAEYHNLPELVTQAKLERNDPLLVEARHLLPRTTAVLEMFSDTPTRDLYRQHSLFLKELPEIVAKSCQDRAAVGSLAEKGSYLGSVYGSGRIHQHAPIGSFPHTATRDVRMMCNQSLDAENLGRWDASSEMDRQALTRLIFNRDRRFQEASRLVNQARAPEIEYEPQAHWTEADALEAQRLLTQYATRRTFAVVSGRGMMHFNARTPLLTEMVPRAQFSMQCILRPKTEAEEGQSMTFSADRSMFTEDKVCWAFFHNGASAGLMISKDADFIDTSWILYNKPSELTNRHAGFLLALGLNGHLKTLAKWVAFKYLTPKHTMTSIGLLLGLAASYRGTADTLITRLLSVHVTCLLPPGAAELNLSPLTQTTGIMGIGLLYYGSQHRRMSEVMLSEIESQEPEETTGDEAVVRDEGYRLAAGMALGLINLGQGFQLHGLHDMRMAERLLAVAVGTKNVDLVHVLDRATAGAVIAIAFIYMKTNDVTIAHKVDIPDTLHQFDYVRPDIFLLRTLARHLIMWDRIAPTLEFVTESLPQQYRHRADLQSVKRLTTNDLPFFHIVGGICFALALRLGGSQREDVRDLLIGYLDQFMRISRLPAVNYDAKVTLTGIRNCLDILALSCSIVMAGSGDIVVYRRLRALHGRTDKDTPFGSHLAAHMAIGALFLSGGTATFGTSDVAIAALVIAFYPLFPTDVLDNRSHLQALRHLWVLAVEHRCLSLRDNETGQVLGGLSASISLKDGSVKTMQTPGLLPDLDTVKTIDIVSEGYWAIHQDLDQLVPEHQRQDPPEAEVKGSKSQKTLRDIYKAASTGINITLHGRSLYDIPNADAFEAEMSALHDASGVPTISSSVATSGLASTATKKENPLNWVFNLPPFARLDHAERALVLQGPSGASNSDIGGQGQVHGPSLLDTTPIDTALDLDLGTLGPEVLAQGLQKQLKAEKLWQIRLLLSWADNVEKKGEEDGVGGRDDGSRQWLRREAIDRLRWRIWRMSESHEVTGQSWG